MIDFSNMLGKPLRHCFVPADQASVTFVFEDGMRRSFGAMNTGGTRITPVAITSGKPTEGVTFTQVDYPLPSNNGVSFVTPGDVLLVTFPVGGLLTELPE